MITLKNWRERMSEDLRLRDMRSRTQEGYLLATRQFVEWAGQEPETLTRHGGASGHAHRETRDRSYPAP